MTPKLDKKETVFRNQYIFACDAKAVNLDNTLINLFMLMRNNGAKIKLKLRSTHHTIDELVNRVFVQEQLGNIHGVKENMDAVKAWLRSNLTNMVFRGNMVKENVSSLRPMHIEAYRIRNMKYIRDYNSSDQVYLMLSKQPNVLKSLKQYLSLGWDEGSRQIINNKQLDVDTVGILHLIGGIEVDMRVATSISRIRPLLEEQADLFCDDIRRLLIYKEVIPRSVFIDYLKTLIGFHLSLYFQKLIHLLPKMIEAGTRNIEDDWSIVVDVTDNLSSNISEIACKDMERTLNGLSAYIKATMEVNAVMMRPEYLAGDFDSIDKMLSEIKNRTEKFEAYYESKYADILARFSDDEESTATEYRKQLNDYLKYEKSYFDRYVQCVFMLKGNYQYRFSYKFIDKVSMKNQENAFMADGRSRKHPRRAVIGSGLLEVLVQLLVLEPENDTYQSKPLSIEELIGKIRTRYGIIIDGTNEERFKNTDVQTHLAFKENKEAFKNKLRQIGFYNDLSDAYILQKIRPRY